ncbi:MAG: SDR family oxidoreductase [Candidatus Omnitrophica bacterium]|nr:SDR family oxidoreductase [Candidatus Omnitrophota bacterium]MBU1046997.1 SDR family oxidoreductase [Candidatus Omnitrophota bacterium]MBU1630772.1 SDR family oxidoreductase [Candidatus Omnitrophota bacterium]MBU1767274.1 SDR family oxidoreductase [Candidatus Omnitrophota bacterium]MBU1889543.1 SDR family oxidoreductase [Candidatus Omnitrophota bacterium]
MDIEKLFQEGFKDKTVLVTGGAGFIGSNIVDRLLEFGATVKIIDDFSEGKEENIQQVMDKIELIRGDIRDIELLRKITKGVNFVFHEAARRSVPKSVDDPLTYNDVNVTGTLNVLLASSENKVDRLVFASSSSIYGEIDEKKPQAETSIPKLISPYAATKMAGEYYCRVFNETYKLPTVALRYFNVFGPRQSLESQYAVVIPKFINCVMKDEQTPIYGDGLQSRDFTYVKNVANFNLLAAIKSEAAGQAFNIAIGQTYTLLQLVDNINKILGKDIKPTFHPPRVGDVKYTWADMSKAKKMLGYSAEVNFFEGLKKTIEWYQKNGK